MDKGKNGEGGERDGCEMRERVEDLGCCLCLVVK